MPKSAKKKKDKAADFSKAKLKLGKGKQQPTNAIDTSFKARSIALPTQSIAVEKDTSTPTTKRKLTFDDLIAHLKHYNVSTRRDALLGLRELFEAHPHLIEPSLTTLLNACVRIIGDDDASVRKALLSFFSWLLPQIPSEQLLPHSSILLLFTTSAQTHIFPEIRIDAIRFLDLYLDIIPDIVVGGCRDGKGGHGKRVLGGYLGVLNAGTKFGDDGDTGPIQATSTASVVLSTTSKRVVLGSLAKFLRHAIASPQSTSPEDFTSASSQSSTPTWYLASSFPSDDLYRSFDALLRPSPSLFQFGPSIKTWKPECDLDTGNEDFTQCFKNAEVGLGESSWTLQDLSESMDLQDGRREYGMDFDSRLARTLHSTLVSTFLDCSPAVFSPSASPPETELSLVQAVGEIYRTVHGSLLRNSNLDPAVQDDVKAILGHMSAYFPFQLTSTNKRDIKVEQVFQDLNLTYCELASLLVLSSQTTFSLSSKSRKASRPTTTSSNRTKPFSALHLQLTRVNDYVVRLLNGEASSSQSSNSLSRSISVQTYVALLPTVWSLLNNGSDIVQEDGTGMQVDGLDTDPTRSVLSAAIAHAGRCSSTSAVKRPAVEFISRLVLLESQRYYVGVFRLTRYPEELKQAQAWIEGLPRTLWELGTNNPVLTEIILRFLLRLFQSRSALLTPQLISSIHSRFIPYFRITHPTRGELAGPFAKWQNVQVQKLALNVATTIAASTSLLSLGDAKVDLREAVGGCVRGTGDLEGYWAEVCAGVA